MTTDTLFNDQIILKRLSDIEADFLYNIYSRPELVTDLADSPFLSNETPQQFANRIISVCEFIWTIRQVSNPDLVIGDCALHHWDKDKKEIEIGGSILPEYWGQGIMQSAFNIIIEVAKEYKGVKTLLGRTQTVNLKAIRLVEKMGFEKVTVDEQNTVLRKIIAD